MGQCLLFFFVFFFFRSLWLKPLWLKLPSRLKILVENSTSVLSIHLDQVSARRRVATGLLFSF